MLKILRILNGATPAPWMRRHQAEEKRLEEDRYRGKRKGLLMVILSFIMMDPKRKCKEGKEVVMWRKHHYFEH